MRPEEGDAICAGRPFEGAPQACLVVDVSADHLCTRIGQRARLVRLWIARDRPRTKAAGLVLEDRAYETATLGAGRPHHRYDLVSHLVPPCFEPVNVEL